MTTATARAYRKGDQVTHLGHPATVTIGNDPADGWGTSPVISISYDKAPRGHSARKDVPAAEVTPLALIPLLAAWLEQEGITDASSAPEVAGRLADAAGDARMAAWVYGGTGSRELRDAAIGIANMDKLSDQELTTELYRHGHYDPRGD